MTPAATMAVRAPRARMRAVTLRRSLGLLLVLALGTLVPFAYASPPDQTWLPGYYDNADYDDVVTLAASIVRGVPAPAPFVVPTPIVVAVVTAVATPAAPPAPEPGPYRLRAPPTA
jgi:hypothetical protein